MRFWDSSALLPLLVREPSSKRIDALLREDPVLAVWWGSLPECGAVLAHLQASRALSGEGFRAASARLAEASKGWVEVLPTEAVREQALRLLRVHSLHAPTAFQLGAAVVASGFRPADLEVVTLDPRLGEAANREGFPLRQ